MMKKRDKGKKQYAPMTSSIAYASVVIYGFGVFFIWFGVSLIVSFFIQSGIFRIFSFFDTFSHLAGGLLSIFLFGGACLWAAHDLRRMEKSAAIVAILYSVLFIFFSIAVVSFFLDDPHFSRYFLQPLHFNLIWLWPWPIAAIIIIWRNLGKMRAREEMRGVFGKTSTKDFKYTIWEGPEEI